jgi:hypothetical protein
MDKTLEDGGGAALALEDGGGAAALRGGIGWRSKIAVAALGGGCSRRTCDDGVGNSVVEAQELLSQRWCQRWQRG